MTRGWVITSNIVLAPTVEDVAAHIAQSSHRLVFMKANLSSGLARAVLPAGIDVLGNSHARQSGDQTVLAVRVSPVAALQAA